MTKLIKKYIKIILKIFIAPYIIYNILGLLKLKKVFDGYVIISPSLTLSGAPLLSEKIYEIISLERQVFFISIFGGQGINSNKKMINMFGTDYEFLYFILSKILQKKGYKKYIMNSIVSSKYVNLFKNSETKCICLIHEMSYAISSLGVINKISEIYNCSDKIVFSCNASFNSFKNFISNILIDNQKIVFMKQGLYEKSFISNFIYKEEIRSNHRKILNIKNNEVVILGIGNDLERKGFKYFLELANCSKKYNSNYKFIWIGENILLKKYAGNNLTIYSQVDKEKIHKYFYSSDFFFLSSIEDPFPTVLLEAMVSGLPLISIKGSGGADELITKEIGFICEKEKIKDAYKYISSLDMKTRKEISKHNHAFVVKNFNFKNYVDRLIDLTRKIY